MGSPARPQAPRDSLNGKTRQSTREVGRGAPEAPLAAPEGVWVGGALSLGYLLAVSTSKEGALY
jgi:hypothetical protein